MKLLFVVLTGLITGTSGVNNNNKATISQVHYQVTIAEAQRILGEPCRLKESTDSSKNYGHQYKSVYLANSSNPKSEKIIALYFMFESYKEETEAKKMYQKFKIPNETHQGFQNMSAPGDEAFFHSDNKNFCLLISRRGNNMIRLKVNKITSKTSPGELKKVAEDVISRTQKMRYSDFQKKAT